MMNIALGLILLGVELVCIALVLLAIVRTGFERLGSSIGIARDGIPLGKTVPAWSLPDLEGRLRVTPTGDHWQLLIFADRSLTGFPGLIVGMHHLAETVQELEVLVISREPSQDSRITAEGLELQVPIVPVDPTFYERFRVRVMPFAFFLDPQGIVRWVGLVNTSDQLLLAWRMAQATTLYHDSSKVV